MVKSLTVVGMLHILTMIHKMYGEVKGEMTRILVVRKNSDGIAILVNSNFSYNITKHQEIIVCRVQALELIINDNDLVLILMIYFALKG